MGWINHFKNIRNGIFYYIIFIYTIETIRQTQRMDSNWIWFLWKPLSQKIHHKLICPCINWDYLLVRKFLEFFSQLCISFWPSKKRYKIHLNALALLVFFRLIVYIMHNQNSLIVHTVSSYRSSSRELSKTLCNYSTFAPVLIHFKYKSRMIKKQDENTQQHPKWIKTNENAQKNYWNIFGAEFHVIFLIHLLRVSH